MTGENTDLGAIPLKSLDAVRRRDRAGWLALFADNAVVEDPVGPNPWDPEGRGRRGKAEIGAFYDMFTAFQEKFDVEVHHTVVRGNEVAMFVTFQMDLKNGTHAATRSINLYRINAAGKIESLRAFWNESDGPAV